MKIPGRKDWEKGPSVRANSNWDTEGFKTEYDVGAGIYEKILEKTLSISFIKETRYFKLMWVAVIHQ